jgi:hypothetical protein
LFGAVLPLPVAPKFGVNRTTSVVDRSFTATASPDPLTSRPPNPK